MGLRVPFPPCLDEAAFQAAVKETLDRIAVQRAIMAVSLVIGIPLIVLMIVWMITNAF